jgi:hypothetical protein
MFDSALLSPQQIAALLRRQQALQAESEVVLVELRLDEWLGDVGPVRHLGSAVHGLMVWRDIDLSVAAADMPAERVFEAIRPLALLPSVREVRYRKDVGRFTPTVDPLHARHYVAASYQGAHGAEWHIDISFWLCGMHPEPVDDTLAHALTPEARVAILWLKELWHRLPAYRHQVFSVDIYDAVLKHGVRTPVAFDGYLAARGKPTRTPDRSRE